MSRASAPHPHGTQRTRPLPLPHVGALDGIRGLAAVAVVLHHALGQPDIAAPGPVGHIIHAVCEYFALGVDLFFVLSGYLITTLLLLARRHRDYYRNFYVKRAFRILPALLLVLFIIAVFLHRPWSGVWPALFFIANYDFFWNGPEIGPFWTLALEEQFYLLWPTLMRRIRPRRLLHILVAVILGCELFRIMLGPQHGRIGNRILHFDGLAWGAVVALLAFRFRVPFRLQNAALLWRRLFRYPLLWGALFTLLLLALAVLHRNNSIFLITAASADFALLLLYLITHPRSAAARLLASRPLRYLGEISYMLYLSHPYWMLAIRPWFGRWLPPDASLAGYLARPLLLLAVSILWSALSLHLFERPISRLRRYLLQPA